MALREELNHDGNEYAFTMMRSLYLFGELHRAGGVTTAATV